MTREDRNRIKMIDTFTKDPVNYKYLNKVLKWQSIPKLKKFLILADDRAIDKNTLINENKYPYFSLTLKELIRKFGGSYGAWSRNINLFATLGFIGKKNPYELNKENPLLFQHNLQGKLNLSRSMGINISNIKDQNFYYLPIYTDETLQIAERRAEIMYKNGFSTKSFSKIFLQRIFGLDFANTIFFNDIEESEFTLEVYNQIQEILLRKLEKKHFTYKEEIINEVDIDPLIYRHYECSYKAKFNTVQAVAEFEFGRSIQIICNEFDIGYAISDKYMKAIFGLKKNKKILFDKNYFQEKKNTLILEGKKKNE